ncbi:Smr domain-containing protein [Desulfocicer vacuolatum DSM 3385]|uniref:Smr domain-containing protein n=2 Tax=Desulfocicer vacuolatum TaxID=2298 RepID=A0A1W1YGZ2_9BACT|nr:Smr domain-containing protein [Desulfocicer vacuolatum DSM 3385]
MFSQLILEPRENKGEKGDQEGDLPKKSRPIPRDRHGLPFLDKSSHLSDLFRVSKTEENEPDENFSELLESSLKGKNQDLLLREKRDREPPRPVPLKKRLKRYPPPQNQLDLHGFTAMEAQSRTESYLRHSWRNGFFTLRVVVGKGLHSESGAVLPHVVEDLLVRLKRDGVVLWFEWDQKVKAHSGAVIVYLNQFD